MADVRVVWRPFVSQGAQTQAPQCSWGQQLTIATLGAGHNPSTACHSVIATYKGQTENRAIWI
jgi:hypothetical protein